MFLTEFTPSYSLTHNGDDAPQNTKFFLYDLASLRDGILRSGRTAPHILRLGARWGVSGQLHAPVYLPVGRWRRQPLNGGLCGPHREKSLPLPEIETRSLNSPSFTGIKLYNKRNVLIHFTRKLWKSLPSKSRSSCTYLTLFEVR